MVEEFKLKQKIKKAYELKKPTFSNKDDYINIVLRSKSPWAADQYDEFIEANNLVINTCEKGIESGQRGSFVLYKDMLKEAKKRSEFAEIARIYYPAIDLIIEGTLKKDKEHFKRAIELMDKAIEACNNPKYKLAPKYAVDIKKKKAQAEKELAII